MVAETVAEVNEANEDVFLKYVRHADIAAHETRGWIVGNDFSDCHHGHHAVLMEDRG